MSDPRKFKNDVVIEGDLNLPAESTSRALTLDSSGNVASSATTSAELAFVSGVTSAIQTQLNTAQSAASDAQTDINDHIADTTDAHDASAISSVPAGNLAATDVQGALNELQSDVDSRALDSVVIKKDGSVAFTADQSMGGFKLTGLAAPSAGSDAATKNYVDNALEGLKPKAAVRVATTVAGTLASSFENGDTIDGVVIATGDRILIKDQAAPATNGIYIVQASGAPVRSTDFDSVSPIDEINKAFVAVQEGTANAGKIFVQYGVVTTLGTDAINFTFFNSVSGLTGGDGITVSGSNVEVDHDGQGLTFVATQLALELDGSTLSKSASGLKLSDTTVTPSTYGNQSNVGAFIVDQQGRLTVASNTPILIASTQVSDFNEAAQDTVGGILANSNTVALAYSDATPSISAQVITQMSVTFDGSGVKLANDSGSPGNTKYYGTDAIGTKGFFDLPAVGSTGDIQQTSFSAADSVVAAANVTGFAFANASVRAFTALVSVSIDGTSDLFEEFHIQGIQKSASWNMSVDSVGDDSGITFSITNAGQIQYTSGTVPGFVSNTIKFRAWVTNV